MKCDCGWLLPNLEWKIDSLRYDTPVLGVSLICPVCGKRHIGSITITNVDYGLLEFPEVLRLDTKEGTSK